MCWMHLRAVFPLAVALVCLPAHAQQPQTAQQAQTAEQAFKNIQALKGTPADQLRPAMQFIAASLGVDCEFCHVQGKFESDEKRNKKTARRMITMTLAINKDSFEGHLEVSCFSCHRGNHDPVAIPPVAENDLPPSEPAARDEHEQPPSAPAGPTADQILEKYVAAVGGADALHKITSRAAKGAISFGGQESPIDLFAKAPDKRMSYAHTPHGDSITAFDGKAGWLGNPGRPPHEMAGAEIDAARLDADFYFPLRIQQIFSQLRVRRPETIDGHPVSVVFGVRQGQPPVRLYFDQTSGLLVRLVRYAETPIGRNPTQIDYADYREADGIRIPFRWTLARTNGRFTIQLREVQQNVAIPDEKFSEPPHNAEGPPPGAPPAH